MASIRENKKNGKVVSYRFIAFLGRDDDGTQQRRYTTWTPPKGFGPAKARKEAEKQAVLWEQSLKVEVPAPPPAPPVEQPQGRHDDFISFIEKFWFPLQVEGKNKKPKTVAFYESSTKLIKDYFAGRVLQEITPMEIEKYLHFLGTKYVGRYGRPLTQKTIHNHYGTLNLIFGYAERQEIITKNPMARVDAPKKERRPVDAFTPEQTKAFLAEVDLRPLEFQSI